ncbi:hypothetical protein FGB62_24g25 [Gracilaria domingensis]|nr:hypothetical protein FGB62_24g25 [Gracilaria domingensis]
MQKHEKEEVLDSISKKLFFAEKDYNARNLELQSFKRVVNVLTKLGETRKEKFKNGEDITILDEFLADNRMRLGHLLSTPPAEGEGYNVDFDAWVADIENDIRARDPLMLSFDSTDGEGFPKATSSRAIEDSQSLSSKGGTLLTILKTNGKLSPKVGNQESSEAVEQSFFCLTTAAWVFAVFGMMVTIGFLAADFWYAQKHVAIHVERSKQQPQELPAITICSFVPNVPSFSNYPSSEYPGLPIFGIQRLTRYNKSTSLLVSDKTYPDILATSSKSEVEDVLLSHDLSQCSGNEGFDVEREMKGLILGNDLGIQNNENEERCYHCIRLGLKSRIKLYPPPSEEDAILPPAINMKLYRTKLLAACRTEYHRRNIMVVSLFVDEIQKYAEQLGGQGVLDFNNEDVEKAFGVDWFRADSHRFFDFSCNVYFFSGFFYPSRDNADISYRFDGSTEERWVKTGSGPYYSAYTWSSNAADINGPNRVAIEKDFFTPDALELYVEEAKGVNITAAVSPSTKVSAIEAAEKTLYKFRTVLSQGKTEYEVIRSTSVSSQLGQSAVDLYNVHFDFDSFETETIVTTPTMTWPEFVIDVFEFIGLFTGICIFTLIVAPAHSLVYPTADTEQK